MLQSRVFLFFFLIFNLSSIRHRHLESGFLLDHGLDDFRSLFGINLTKFYSGVCVDHLNNYTCQCAEGFTGYNCEIDIDECLSSPCYHGKIVDAAL